MLWVIDYVLYINFLKKEKDKEWIKEFLSLVKVDYFFNFINENFFDNKLKNQRDFWLIELIINDYLEIKIIYLDNLKINKNNLDFLKNLNNKKVIDFNNFTF